MAARSRAGSRDTYWTERFLKAESDPDEARALLTLFATLADDAEGFDPQLVQWVAKRVKTWSEAGFGREKVARAFGTKKAPHAPKSDRAAEKRAIALAKVHRLSRVERIPLPEAFVAAGKLASLSEHQVRDDYEAFRKVWPKGGSVSDWMPVLLRIAAAEREQALAAGAKGRPRKKHRV